MQRRFAVRRTVYLQTSHVRARQHGKNVELRCRWWLAHQDGLDLHLAMQPWSRQQETSNVGKEKSLKVREMFNSSLQKLHRRTVVQ